jgi:hypothetical protein
VFNSNLLCNSRLFSPAMHNVLYVTQHQKQSVWHAAWRRRRLNSVGAVHNHITAASPLCPLSDCLPRYCNVVLQAIDAATCQLLRASHVSRARFDAERRSELNASCTLKAIAMLCYLVLTLANTKMSPLAYTWCLQSPQLAM